jgi:hypothetical protein
LPIVEPYVDRAGFMCKPNPPSRPQRSPPTRTCDQVAAVVKKWQAAGSIGSYFDYVRLDQGRIVERVQQADILGQMRRLYGRVLGVAGVSAMQLRQHPPDHTTQST